MASSFCPTRLFKRSIVSAEGAVTFFLRFYLEQSSGADIFKGVSDPKAVVSCPLSLPVSVSVCVCLFSLSPYFLSQNPTLTFFFMKKITFSHEDISVQMLEKDI